MTKMRKAVVFMTVLGLTSMLFAEAPKSIKKTATNDLIKDELVDNFAVGIDDAKGLWFGGYNGKFNNFSVGYGNYFGNLWVSVYDDMNTLSFDRKNTNEVTTDAVAKDGVNVDYTDTSSVKTNKDAANRNIKNDLYISGTVNKIGGQFYWKLDDTTPSTNNKTVTESYTTADDKHYNKTDKVNVYNAKNTFGFYVFGLKLPETGKINFFVELKDIGLEWNAANRTSSKLVEKTVYGEDGVLGTTSTETKRVTRGAGNSLTPYAAYNLGFNLPEVGLAQNKFSMYGKFSYMIPLNTSKLNSVVEDNNATQLGIVKTTTKKEVTKANVKGKWTNEMTPKVTTTYNFGDRLTAKTAFSAKVETSGQKTGVPSMVKLVEDVETVDNTNATTVKTHEESKTYDASYNGYNTVEVTTTVEPNATLGMNFAVKPGKFDVYVGGKWNAGTLTFTHTSKKEKAVVDEKVVTTTDEFGKETVTTNTKTLHVADTAASGTGKTESRTFEFKGTSPSNDTLWIGSKLYLTENLQMDLAFSSALNTFSIMGSSNGLLTSALSVTFAVKF